MIREAPAAAIGAIAVFVLWALAEGAVHCLRLFQPDGSRRQRAALGWLQAAYAASLVVGCLDALVFRTTTWIPPGVAWFGVIASLAGVLIRVVARVQIGRNFSAYVQTCEGHRLVTSGLYRHVRHPAYTGFVLMLIGFPIGFGSAASLAIALGIGLPALSVRIRAEEAALTEWFGDDYRAFQRATPSLFPRVW